MEGRGRSTRLVNLALNKVCDDRMSQKHPRRHQRVLPAVVGEANRGSEDTQPLDCLVALIKAASFPFLPPPTLKNTDCVYVCVCVCPLSSYPPSRGGSSRGGLRLHHRHVDDPASRLPRAHAGQDRHGHRLSGANAQPVDGDGGGGGGGDGGSRAGGRG